jgi:hypothetical protein
MQHDRARLQVLPGRRHLLGFVAPLGLDAGRRPGRGIIDHVIDDIGAGRLDIDVVEEIILGVDQLPDPVAELRRHQIAVAAAALAVEAGGIGGVQARIDGEIRRAGRAAHHRPAELGHAGEAGARIEAFALDTNLDLALRQVDAAGDAGRGLHGATTVGELLG